MLIEVNNDLTLELFHCCKKSTELHFGSIEKQIEIIQHDLRNNYAEGNFFITKHSNLPLIHIIFHLIIHPDSFATELSQKSLVVQGLRNILKITSKYDIKEISIPLFFLPDSSGNNLPASSPNGTGPNTNLQNDSVFLTRRAETVLKCTKGFILEGINSGLQGSTSSQSSTSANTDFSMLAFRPPPTIQFVIPENFQNSESLFEGAKTMIQSIYKTI